MRITVPSHDHLLNLVHEVASYAWKTSNVYNLFKRERSSRRTAFASADDMTEGQVYRYCPGFRRT
jgi:hypothetical protein